MASNHFSAIVILCGVSLLNHESAQDLVDDRGVEKTTLGARGSAFPGDCPDIQPKPFLHPALGWSTSTCRGVNKRLVPSSSSGILPRHPHSRSLSNLTASVGGRWRCGHTGTIVGHTAGSQCSQLRTPDVRHRHDTETGLESSLQDSD